MKTISHGLLPCSVSSTEVWHSFGQMRGMCSFYLPLFRGIFNGVWEKEVAWCISTQIGCGTLKIFHLECTLSILSVWQVFLCLGNPWIQETAFAEILLYFL